MEATSADGVNASKEENTGYRYSNVVLVSEIRFETGFFLIAPIGATVGAWGIALFLQYVAERHAGMEKMRPRNLGNFIVLNVPAIAYGGLSLFSCFRLYALGGVLPAAAVVAACFSCCTKFSFRRVKMFIGIGVGYGISVVHLGLLALMYIMGLEGHWSVQYCAVVVFNVAVSLFLAVSLIKAIRQSFENYPADMKALTWRLNCRQTTDSAGNPDDEADPTIFGTALVTWSLYTCAHFVVVLALAVRPL